MLFIAAELPTLHRQWAQIIAPANHIDDVLHFAVTASRIFCSKPKLDRYHSAKRRNTRFIDRNSSLVNLGGEFEWNAIDVRRDDIDDRFRLGVNPSPPSVRLEAPRYLWEVSYVEVEEVKLVREAWSGVKPECHVTNEHTTAASRRLDPAPKGGRNFWRYDGKLKTVSRLSSTDP